MGNFFYTAAAESKEGCSARCLTSALESGFCHGGRTEVCTSHKKGPQLLKTEKKPGFDAPVCSFMDKENQDEHVA